MKCNEDCFNCTYDDCIKDMTPKEKQQAYLREYYIKHKEKMNAYSKWYYETHKDHLAEVKRNKRENGKSNI